MKAVIWATVKEFIRNKIFYGILGMAVVIIFWSVLISSLALGETQKIVVDFGLSAIEFFGLLTVLFLGSYLLWNEINKNTILLVLSKNPSRAQFLLGKFLGFSVVLILEIVVMLLALLAVMVFYGVPLKVEVIKAVYLVFLKLEVLLAFVLFFSTFVSPFVALFGAIGVYFVAHSTSFIRFFLVELGKGGALEQKVATVLYYIFPNFEGFSLKEYLLSPYLDSYNWLRIGMFSLEAAFYIFVLLLAAVMIFERREF